MRLLLISDTHGRLGIINELAARVRADAVIHGGDFGFYDDGSLERISRREVRLRVAHSHLSRVEKDRILALRQPDLVRAARKHRLMGDFQSFLDGRESFRVPVYAVWGNHEDADVLRLLSRGDLAVKNLHILDSRRVYRVGSAYVFGLGGNLLLGPKMMQAPIAGGGGRIWSTLSQYADLVKTVESDASPDGPRIFVSHVSPGKEPFVELIGVRTRADYTISGHMGAPACMVWNAFAVHSEEEAEQRLWAGFRAVRDACMAQEGTNFADEAFGRIATVPTDSIRGEPRWYRGMTHINLPDAEVGYALMDLHAEAVALQCYAGSTVGAGGS